jgi:hypothetical protein
MWVVIGVMLKNWNAELHPPSSINQIVPMQKKYSETVVVGEPLMWDMTLLTQTLKENGRKFILKPQDLSANRDMGLDLFISKEK